MKLEELHSPGFTFVPMGDGWNHGFQFAANLLETGTAHILMGDKIGVLGQKWLEDCLFSKKSVRFGAQLFPWKDWIKDRAREVCLEKKEAFRTLDSIRERELFRETITLLSKESHLPLLSELLQNESFFASILSTVKELRNAGLKNRDSIERAMELLGKHRESEYRELWILAAAYEARLNAATPRECDDSDLSELAIQTKTNTPIFLIGLSKASLLEIDLLQSLAKRMRVFVAICADLDEIQKTMQSKDQKEWSSSLLFLRSLTTNFSGEIKVQSILEKSRSTSRAYVLAEAQTEMEELRAAATFARLVIEEKKYPKTCLLLPKNFLHSTSLKSEFLGRLGYPSGNSFASPAEHPLGRLVLHALELVDKDFALGPALDYAELLCLARGGNPWPELALQASKLGIRKGLREWRSRSEIDSQIADFSQELIQLHHLFPKQGSSANFHEALLKFSELTQFSNLAKQNLSLSAEREAHTVLSAILRKSAHLSASLKGEYSYSSWLSEFRLALRTKQEGLENGSEISLGELGEWLPPSKEKTLYLALGLNANAEPSAAPTFFLEESVRRKLADFLLPQALEKELEFLNYFKTILAKKEILLSRARQNTLGADLKASWVLSTESLETRNWPQASFPMLEKITSTFKVEIGNYQPKHFSASLVNDYKKCAFYAFVNRVLRVEDKVQFPELDIRRLEEGSFVHRVLEIFYLEKNGRDASTEELRKPLLRESLEMASAELKARYYMGSPRLLSLQLDRLEKLLLLYLAEEAKFFAANPEVKVFDCEWDFMEVIGGKKFEGTIDRIDIDSTTRCFFVVDYKIGSTPDSKEVKELQDLQLFVYLDAAEKRVEMEAAAAYYGSLQKQKLNQGLIKKKFNRSKKSDAEEKKYFSYGSSTGALVSDEDFEKLRLAARNEIVTVATKLESGSFPVEPLKPSDCEHCRARPACRISESEWVEAESESTPTQEQYFSLLNSSNQVEAKEAKKALSFNERQEEALSKEGSLVFLEASAGTGKTTVLVEKVRRFLAKKISSGDSPFQAVEKFVAITFSEKAATELSERLSELLLTEYGPEIAAQAQSQVSTIHGFCRRIINELPLEAGANPLAEMLDAKTALELQSFVFQELFLSANPRAQELMAILNQEYDRGNVQAMLEVLVRSRSLVEEQAQAILDYGRGVKARPANFILPELEDISMLGALLELFQIYCEMYDQEKWQRSQMDFSDLERLALRAMRFENSSTLFRDSIDLLLVDEFQDTNSIQRSILELVALPNFANAFVVGDAKQSIYRFRDADVSVFQSLRKEAAAKKSLYELDVNFRSQSQLVHFATAVSQSMFPSPAGEGPSFEANWTKVAASKAAAKPVQILEYALEDDDSSAETRRKTEAKMLVSLIKKLLNEGKKLDDITILFRKLSGNRDYFQALKAAGIPFRIGSSSSFYQQMVILDCLCLLRALFSAHNELALVALLRSPWFGLSDRELFSLYQKEGANLWSKLDPSSLDLLFKWRKESRLVSLSELLRRALLMYPNYSNRHIRLQAEKFLQILESLESQDLSRFEVIELLSQWAGWDKEKNATKEESISEDSKNGSIQILTVHASKGLEFEVVILPDLDSATPNASGNLRFIPSVGAGLVSSEVENEEGIIALLKEKNKEREFAESKRLLYVALTRAKQEQYILLQKQPKRKGEWGNILRALPSNEYFEKINFSWGDGLSSPASVTKEKTTEGRSLPMFSNIASTLSSTSISEIAAYQFCAEFHRLKFVQKWDDLVVAGWSVPVEWTRKLKSAKRRLVIEDIERERVGVLLKGLELERKERGIALHRVLERLHGNNLDRESARLWLVEAYLAQGAMDNRKVLTELLDLDLQVLTRFLSSEIGRKLFAEDIEAFPEIPFIWNFSDIKIHGAIDRLIKHSSSHWTVVDYKSSILEESRERYEFQVSAYRAAIEQKLLEEGIESPKVDAYLVNLLNADVVPVTGYAADIKQKIQFELEQIKENYSVTETGRNPREREITGKVSCFSCPYVLHCDVGSDFVLR